MTIFEPNFLKRINNLQSRMIETNVDLTVIAPTANMLYLLGFAPLMDERFCAIMISTTQIQLVVPTLNADQVEKHTSIAVSRWSDEEGPMSILSDSLQKLGVNQGCTIAVDDSMRADFLLLLQDFLQPKLSISAGKLISPLRLKKSRGELEGLRYAASMADAALSAGADACKPGFTERQVAQEIEKEFYKLGAEKIDFNIVASGPNGAFPHHKTGNRKLQAGDTIVIDCGGTFKGYKSDITRVVHLGDPTDEVQAVYSAVREANQRGRTAAVAGARAKEVDHAVRSYLEERDFGQYFVHRTGHGLGLDVHEPPWITADNEDILSPGMVFSIEPGVYIPGKFGVRIEDIVTVTAGECEVLTGLDHELITR